MSTNNIPFSILKENHSISSKNCSYGIFPRGSRTSSNQRVKLPSKFIAGRPKAALLFWFFLFSKKTSRYRHSPFVVVVVQKR